MFHKKDARIVVLCAAMAACSLGQTKPAPSAAATGALPPAGRTLSVAEMREAQLAADTERLYQLAQELKVELDKTTKDTLSLAVVKKAAEIERLAHSISERMKAR